MAGRNPATVERIDDGLVARPEPRPIHVLHCIGSLGGGGAERQLRYLAAELRNRGLDFHLAYIRGGPNMDGLEAAGVDLHPLSSRHNYDPRLLGSLIHLIREIRPQLIQTWLPQMDILGGMAARVTGIPFIITERSVAAAHRQWWRSQLRGWIARRASAIVANSDSGSRYWLKRSPAHRVATIRNGVPHQEILRSPMPSLASYGISEDAKILLFAGRYSAEKNVLVLIDAMARVLAARPDSVAVLFGQGPMRPQMIELVRHSGMQERIRILDYTADLWNWMRRAAVFVSISTFEGCPNTVLEAAVQRCPLLLSDIPAHHEIFSPESAQFACAESASEVAAALLNVLRDPDAASQRAERGFAVAVRFSVANMAEQYLNLYRAVLNAGEFGSTAELGEPSSDQ